MNGMLPHPRITPLPVNTNPEDEAKQYARAIRKALKVFYILVWGMLGVALVSFPWMRFWDDNTLLYLYPQIRPVVDNFYLKGFVLGLGIANILIGIYEVVHFKCVSKGFFS